jgi:hypothetical protein
MSSLQVIADGIWAVQAPLQYLGVLQIGTRMTVLRAGDGLVVHSPIPIDDELKTAIDALGRVDFVIAPNAYHHLFAGDAAKAWPQAKLLAPTALRQKRKDLRVEDDIESALPAAWGGDLEASTASQAGIRSSASCIAIAQQRRAASKSCWIWISIAS